MAGALLKPAAVSPRRQGQEPSAVTPVWVARRDTPARAMPANAP